MNCLAYALRFWKQHSKYRLYYNSCHVINSDENIGGSFLPLESFGYKHILKAFRNLLDKEELKLLKDYFRS